MFPLHIAPPPHPSICGLTIQKYFLRLSYINTDNKDTEEDPKNKYDAIKNIQEDILDRNIDDDINNPIQNLIASIKEDFVDFVDNKSTEDFPEEIIGSATQTLLDHELDTVSNIIGKP